MLNSRIIPVLLLKDSKLVKSIKFKSNKYIGDPINAMKVFSDKYVDEIAILDIGASKAKSINYDLISKMAEECFSPLTYGGGIQSVEDASRLFKLGCEKISVDSLLRTDPEIIRELVKIYGASSIICSIDLYKIMNKYYIYNYNNIFKINILKRKFLDYLKFAEDLGVGELFINFVSKDGTFDGFDFETIKLLANQLRLPVTVCGGCSDFNEIYELSNYTNISGIAAGSIFVYRSKMRGVLINYPEIDEIEKKIGFRE